MGHEDSYDDGRFQDDFNARKLSWIDGNTVI